MIRMSKKFSEQQIGEEGLKESGFLVDGKKEGLWRLTLDDHLLQTTTYKHDKIEGLVTIYERNDDDKDVKVAEGNQRNSAYDMGIEVNCWDGEVTFWNTDGEIKQIDNYKNGKLHGESIWYSSGNLFDENENNRITHIKNYKNGHLHGKQTYLAGGKRLGEKSYIHYLDGVKHGIEEEFYKNGVRRSKREWINGEIEGIYENFNKDGELTIRSNRKRSLKHGVMETFDLMREKKNYEYGYVNGTYEYFGMGPIDKNMSLLIKGSYISLKKIEKKGVVKKIEKDTEYMLSYLKDKKIDRANVTGVGFFFGLNRISLKNGCWEYFGKDGKLITRKYFKNGKLTTKKLHEKKISLQDSQ